MDSERKSLQASIAIERLSSNAYEIEIPLDFCFGRVAHGGYEVSLIAEVVQHHSNTTLKKINQPHSFNIHAFFFRPATAGKAVVAVEEKNIGSGVSTVTAILSQKGKERMMASVSNTNMHDQHGPSYPTNYHLTPAPTPADISSLATDSDPRWIKWTFPWDPQSFLKPYTHLSYHLPIQGPPHPSLTDVWMTPHPADDVFRTESLGLIADLWPRMLENYCPEDSSEWSTASLVRRAVETGSASSIIADFNSSGKKHQLAYWYPTLSMTLEVKKLLPGEGVKWLFVRAQAKEIKNGRMDAEVFIFDADLELVALSHHVCLVVDNARGPLRASERERKL